MLPPIGILAAWNYHKEGFVEWNYALLIAAAFVIGGYFGSRWAVTVDARLLKNIWRRNVIGRIKTIA